MAWLALLISLGSLVVSASSFYFQHWYVRESVRVSLVRHRVSDDQFTGELALVNDGTRSAIVSTATFMVAGGFGRMLPLTQLPAILKAGDMLMFRFTMPVAIQRRGPVYALADPALTGVAQAGPSMIWLLLGDGLPGVEALTAQRHGRTLRRPPARPELTAGRAGSRCAGDVDRRDVARQLTFADELGDGLLAVHRPSGDPTIASTLASTLDLTVACGAGRAPGARFFPWPSGGPPGAPGPV